MSIEAIVSDVGGVIVRDDFPSFFAKFEARIGAFAEAFYALTVGSEEWRLYNKGFITEVELLAHGVELSEPKRRRKREESDGL